MSRTRKHLSGALVALAALLGAGCPPAPQEQPKPLKELIVQKVSATLDQPDPAAPFWKGVPTGIITMIAQPMIAPRPEKTTTESVFVQAVHDGSRVAFRLRWKDPEKSEAGRLAEYSDAFALEFPAHDGPVPPVMMGARGMPVHLFHWRAQYQRDLEKGKPTMKDLYPNMSVDMYPLEQGGSDAGAPVAAEKFSPGRAEGNPQSYQKGAVDEIIAEGFSTSSVQEGHGSVARGAWFNGEWTLVIVRPLVIEGGSTLRSGSPGNVAFAAWQGGQGEVGSRKCVAMNWTPLTIQ